MAMERELRSAANVMRWEQLQTDCLTLIFDHLAVGSCTTALYRAAQVCRRWSVAAQLTVGYCVARLQGDHGVESLAYVGERQWLAAGCTDATAHLWDCRARQQFGALPLPAVAWAAGSIFSLCSVPNLGLLAGASYDATVKIWDLKSKVEVGVLRGHSNWVNAVVSLDDWGFIASAGGDNSIQLHDPMTRKVVSRLAGHFAPIHCLAFFKGPRGQRLLASGSADHTIKLWELGSDGMGTDCIAVLPGHRGTVRALAYLEGQSLLASGARDATIILWDMEALDQNHCHTAGVGIVVDASLSVHPDTSDDQPTHQSLPIVAILEGHRSVVYAVIAVQVNGVDWLASGGMDQSICLWDLRDCQKSDYNSTKRRVGNLALLRPRVLRGHKGWVTSLAWLNDEGLLASGSADNSIRLWRLQSYPATAQPESEQSS